MPDGDRARGVWLRYWPVFDDIRFLFLFFFPFRFSAFGFRFSIFGPLFRFRRQATMNTALLRDGEMAKRSVGRRFACIISAPGFASPVRADYARTTTGWWAGCVALCSRQFRCLQHLNSDRSARNPYPRLIWLIALTPPSFGAGLQPQDEACLSAYLGVFAATRSQCGYSYCHSHHRHHYFAIAWV